MGGCCWAELTVNVLSLCDGDHPSGAAPGANGLNASDLQALETMILGCSVPGTTHTVTVHSAAIPSPRLMLSATGALRRRRQRGASRPPAHGRCPEKPREMLDQTTDSASRTTMMRY